jgi:hypothetical protein
MAWYTTAKQCCESFLPASRRASANYCIGKDGEIWLNVEEKNRAWTTSSAYNDNRAVTIECANYMDANRYGMLPDKTWDSLVNLCADICFRNGIERINYTGTDSGNLTKHKWYADTDCPGPWLDKEFETLAKEINKILDEQPKEPVKYSGKYMCVVDTLNVRSEPSMMGDIVAAYHCGDTVYLDDYRSISDGFVWGRYIGFTSGQYRYVAIGPNNSVEPSISDYLIKV